MATNIIVLTTSEEFSKRLEGISNEIGSNSEQIIGEAICIYQEVVDAVRSGMTPGYLDKNNQFRPLNTKHYALRKYTEKLKTSKV